MEGMELFCFEIISHTGSARSSYIEAIKAAKSGDFQRAEELMDEGENQYCIGHKVHAKLVQQEAFGEATPVSLLLLHAADLMMSAETLRIMAKEFINLYMQLNNKGA